MVYHTQLCKIFFFSLRIVSRQNTKYNRETSFIRQGTPRQGADDDLLQATLSKLTNSQKVVRESRQMMSEKERIERGNKQQVACLQLDNWI